MASSSDFMLHPYQESWDQHQPYVRPSTYADQSYLVAPSFDSYQPHESLVQHSQRYDFACHSQLTAPALSSNYSPASSTSYSFDYNKCHISSISDSGASVQSAISSAIASPSMHPQADECYQQSYPNILQYDGFFAGNLQDMEMVPVLEKGCVGKRLSQ